MKTCTLHNGDQPNRTGVRGCLVIGQHVVRPTAVAEPGSWRARAHEAGAPKGCVTCVDCRGQAPWFSFYLVTVGGGVTSCHQFSNPKSCPAVWSPRHLSPPESEQIGILQQEETVSSPTSSYSWETKV